MTRKLYYLALALALLACSPGCEDLESLPGEGEGSLFQGLQERYEQSKEVLSELAWSVPRTAHDRNLQIIDRAVDLYIMVEGEEPRCVGEPGQPHTLVGEGYLEKVPPIPMGLRQESGPWSCYTLEGRPPRAAPRGDWDTP